MIRVMIVVAVVTALVNAQSMPEDKHSILWMSLVPLKGTEHVIDERLVYDMRTIPEHLVKQRMNKNGDGSRTA
ncbi:hypothetical protein CBL_11038 [Carabus blaptoides fortunei]